VFTLYSRLYNQLYNQFRAYVKIASRIVCQVEQTTSNLELRISYGCGLSSPMFDTCRLDRSWFVNAASSPAAESAHLTFRARLPNVSAMSSNAGSWNESTTWWTRQYVQQSRDSSRGNFIPSTNCCGHVCRLVLRWDCTEQNIVWNDYACWYYCTPEVFCLSILSIWYYHV